MYWSQSNFTKFINWELHSDINKKGYFSQCYVALVLSSCFNSLTFHLWFILFDFEFVFPYIVVRISVKSRFIYWVFQYLFIMYHIIKIVQPFIGRLIGSFSNLTWINWYPLLISFSNLLSAKLLVFLSNLIS